MNVKLNDALVYTGHELGLRGQQVLVVGLNCGPGKDVGLCFKNKTEGLHECDGLTPTKHGLWARRDQVATPERWESMARVELQIKQAKKATSKAVEEFLK